MNLFSDVRQHKGTVYGLVLSSVLFARPLTSTHLHGETLPHVKKAKYIWNGSLGTNKHCEFTFIGDITLNFKVSLLALVAIQQPKIRLLNYLCKYLKKKTKKCLSYTKIVSMRIIHQKCSLKLQKRTRNIVDLRVIQFNKRILQQDVFHNSRTHHTLLVPPILRPGE